MASVFGTFAFRLNMRFLGFILPLIISCSKAHPSPRPGELSLPPDKTKAYEFRGEGCSTGKHVFSEEDALTLVNSYCSALLTDDINNNCAREQRQAAFDLECSHPGTDQSSTQKQPSSDKKPANSNSLRSQQGPIPADKEITFSNASPLGALSQLSRLKINMLTPLSYFVPEQYNNVVDSYIDDLADCFFSSNGPLCLEGQRQETLTHEYIFIDGKPYLFIVNAYGLMHEKIAVFFPLVSEDASLTHFNGKAFFYLITDEVFSLNISKILSFQAAFAFAEVSFEALTWEILDQLLVSLLENQDTAHIRGAIYVLNQLHQDLDFIPLANQAEVMVHLKEAADMLVKHSELVELSAPTLYFFLNTTIKILQPENALEFLHGFLEHPHEEFRMAAQVLAAYLGGDFPDQTLLAHGLSSKLPFTQILILNYIQKERQLPDSRFLQHGLIQCLQSEHMEIAAAAYAILATKELGPESIQDLANVLRFKDAKFMFAWMHAVVLIKKNALETQQKNIFITLLDHPNPLLRAQLFQDMRSYSLSDEEDSQSLAPYLNSKQADTIFFAIELLIKINADFAKLFLLENIDNPNETTRQKIKQELQKVKFSDFHVPVLLAKYHQGDANRRKQFIQFIISVASQESTKQLIKLFCGETDEKNRLLLFAAVKAMPLLDSVHLDPLGAHISGCNQFSDVIRTSLELIISMGTVKSEVKLLYSNILFHSQAWVRTLVQNYVKNINPVLPEHLSVLKNNLQCSDPEGLNTTFNLILRGDPDITTGILIERLDTPNKDIRDKIIMVLKERSQFLRDQDRQKLLEYFSGKKSLDDDNHGGIRQTRKDLRQAALSLLLNAGDFRYIEAALAELLTTVYDDGDDQVFLDALIPLFQKNRSQPQLKSIIKLLFRIILEVDTPKLHLDPIKKQRPRQALAAALLQAIGEDDHSIKSQALQLLDQGITAAEREFIGPLADL